MNRSIIDTAVRIDRPRVRRHLRRLAMTSYRLSMSDSISDASDAAMQALHEALPDTELLVLQVTSRRAAA